jgi:hypothetical protein
MTWPTKTDFVDGDVLTAAQVNNIGTNLNVFNPTSATNGQVWIANGTGGGAYGTPPAGGMTQLATGTLTGSTSYDLTGFSQSYKNLELWFYNFSQGSAQSFVVRSFKTSANFSGGSHVYSNIKNTNTTVSASGSNTTADFNQLEFANTGLIGGNTTNYFRCVFYNYSEVGNMKYATGTGVFWNNSGQNSSDYSQSTCYRNTAANVDTIRILAGSGATMNNIKYILFGVS